MTTAELKPPQPPRRYLPRRAAVTSGPPVSKKTRWTYRGLSLLIAVIILAVWELLPRTGLVSDIVLPSLSSVAEALWTLIQMPTFWSNFLVTMREILGGFVFGTLIGLVLGIALAVWRSFRQISYPYVVGFQAIPKIVFAPLFIAWFGYGETSKVVMGIAIAFFPVLINTLVGLESVPADMVKLMRSLRATPCKSSAKSPSPTHSPSSSPASNKHSPTQSSAPWSESSSEPPPDSDTYWTPTTSNYASTTSSPSSSSSP